MNKQSTNKVILVGRLGKDPEMRYTQSGSAVANFNLATSESWKGKESGEWEDHTEWHRCVFFGKLAEIAEKVAHKGDMIYLEGKLKTRKWEDKDGVTRYTTEVVGSELTTLSNRHSDQPVQGNQETIGNDDEEDDDLPF